MKQSRWVHYCLSLNWNEGNSSGDLITITRSVCVQWKPNEGSMEAQCRLNIGSMERPQWSPDEIDLGWLCCSSNRFSSADSSEHTASMWLHLNFMPTLVAHFRFHFNRCWVRWALIPFNVTDYIFFFCGVDFNKANLITYTLIDAS